MRQWKRDVWIHWFFTYLTLLTIPTILSIFIYQQSVRALNDRLNDLIRASLVQVQMNVDGELQKVVTAANQYLNNKAVREATLTEPSDPHGRRLWVEAVKSMKEGLAATPLISNIGIYLIPYDRMLTNNGDCALSTYGRVYLWTDVPRSLKEPPSQEEETRLAELKALLTAKQPGVFRRSGIAALYLYTSPLRRNNSPVGTLSIVLKQSHLKELLRQTEWVADGEITLMDPYGSKVSSVQRGTEEGTSVAQEIISPKTGWIYRIETPSSVYAAFTRGATQWSAVGLAASLLLGLAAAVFFTHRSGKPILSLYSQLDQRIVLPEPAPRKSIYQAMQDAIDAMLADYRNQSESNKKNLRAHRERILLAALDGYGCSPEFFAVLLDALGVPRDGCSYLVGRFSCVPDSFELPEGVRALWLYEGSEAVMLAFVHDDMAPESLLHAVRERAGEAARRDGRMSAAFSQVKHASADLPAAGMEARQACDRGKEGAVRVYESTERDDDPPILSASFPRPLIDRLMQCVQRKALREGAQMLLDWVERLDENGAAEITRARWEAAQLVGAIVEEIQPWMDKSLLERENPIPQILLSGSLEEVRALINRFFIKLEESLLCQRDLDLAVRAISYIERVYDDANMSLGSIAHALEVSPSSLTRKFKANVGVTVLDFIHATRIARAKEMLLLPAGERPTIEEIARRTGFQSATTFVRIFKQREGVTPSQFR